MKSAIFAIKKTELIESSHNNLINDSKCQLVLGFGNKELLADRKYFDPIRNKFPKAEIVTCSTAGEIFGKEVYDDSISVLAMEFEKTTIKAVNLSIHNFKNSFEAGGALIDLLPETNLKYVLVLSDGSFVNGSELVRGIDSKIKKHIPVTGGLAGNGTNFHSTITGLNQPPDSANIVAVGFYGDNFIVKSGSMGGWDSFGIERKVTKSVSNRLYEIDNNSALSLYKSYLGKHIENLPSSALLFPLSVILPDSKQPVVRTILSIDEKDNCMVFAGDIPQDSKVRFMRANFDSLINAAGTAAENTLKINSSKSPNVAILISCVGRKIILGKRINEEVEAVAEALGPHVLLSGFYSYGEISQESYASKCEFHNQTMTITTFDEI